MLLLAFWFGFWQLHSMTLFNRWTGNISMYLLPVCLRGNETRIQVICAAVHRANSRPTTSMTPRGIGRSVCQLLFTLAHSHTFFLPKYRHFHLSLFFIRMTDRHVLNSLGNYCLSDYMDVCLSPLSMMVFVCLSSPRSSTSAACTSSSLKILHYMYSIYSSYR